jgi:hypothetical protein
MVLPSEPQASSPSPVEEEQLNHTKEYDEEEEDDYNQQLRACQISFWYPLFAPDGMKKTKQQCTFRTIFLDDLPNPEFVQYLHADQVILPKGVKTSSALLEGASSMFESDDDDDEDDDEEDQQEEEEDTDSSSRDDQEEEGHDEDGEGDSNASGCSTRSKSSNNNRTTKRMMHDVQMLSRRMEDAIHSLGGAVIPKLNWSAPKDAVWMNGGTLECRRAGDIFLLLKSSDFIAHDLQQMVRLEATKKETTNAPQPKPEPQQQQQQPDLRQQQDRLFLRPQLALRKWANLHPSQEFRCFCRNRHLVGICQRHHTEYYPHLANHDHDQIRSTIRTAIDVFFRTVLLACSAFPLDSYVFDVYVDRKHKVWLVDFNVWGPTTDALLFDWEELTTLQEEEEMAELDHNDDAESAAADVEFRVVSHPLHVQAHPLSSYKAPVDVLDLAGDSQQFREFMNLCEKKRR